MSEHIVDVDKTVCKALLRIRILDIEFLLEDKDVQFHITDIIGNIFCRLKILHKFCLSKRNQWDYFALSNLNSNFGNLIDGFTMDNNTLTIKFKVCLDLSNLIFSGLRTNDDRISVKITTFISTFMATARILIP